MINICIVGNGDGGPSAAGNFHSCAGIKRTTINGIWDKRLAKAQSLFPVVG